MSQEPHYQCAVTEEMFPESELESIEVHRIEDSGHSHFKREYLDAVWVNLSALPISQSVVGVNLLVGFGRVLMVYKEDLTYGRCHDPDNLSDDELEHWQNVADKAMEGDA